jgi:hypothetical protein
VATQRLAALLFGTWFRVVNHCEYNAMTSEAMSKSIAGSIFHTCAATPAMVNDAVRLIRIIIDDFGAASVLGRANVQYFTERTCTAIKVREKFKYQLSGSCPITSDDTEAGQAECGKPESVYLLACQCLLSVMEITVNPSGTWVAKGCQKRFDLKLTRFFSSCVKIVHVFSV